MPVGHVRLGQLTACPAGRNRLTSVAATPENTVTPRFRLTRRPAGAAHGSGLRLGHSEASRRPTAWPWFRHTAWPVDKTRRFSVAATSGNRLTPRFRLTRRAAWADKRSTHRLTVKAYSDASRRLTAWSCLQRAPPTRPTSVAATSENTVTSRFRRTRRPARAEQRGMPQPHGSGLRLGHGLVLQQGQLATGGLARISAYSVACWQKTPAFGGSHTRKHSDVTLLAYSEANLAMISACSVASRQNTSVFGSSHMRKHSDPAGSAGASAS